MAVLGTARSAVVDIGSNSVRMVVFDDDDRSLEPVFNEKSMSMLGRDLLTTGRLNPEGRASALAILARFRCVLESLGVQRMRAVATAAAREASDSAAFIAEACAALGAPIEVISGEEEARLSACGVICGIPGADGVISDLGGGSLEVAEVRQGEVHGPVSLSLGPLGLGRIVDLRQEARLIDERLAAVPAGLARGRALYVVGGAWRALAKHYFERRHYPIRIIHEFELAAEDALKFVRLVGRTRENELSKLKGMSGRRREAAPYSSRLLGCLIERLQPERIVFSAYGLREGVQYVQMSAGMRGLDPLLDHCRRLGQSGARAPFDGERLAEWALAAFDAPPADLRLVRAAAWLSDMSGNDHPDYRGHHAAARALHLASAAISHRERVFLAASVYARYHGFGMEGALGRAAELVDEATRRRATALGMTFRLAHAIAPGGGLEPAPGLRRGFSLRRTADRLSLIADGVDPGILGETARRRLAGLAQALAVDYAIVRIQSAAA